MTSWQNHGLMKWPVDEMTCWWNDNFMKWPLDWITHWWNDELNHKQLMKLPVDEMTTVDKVKSWLYGKLI
jgi:hypothetical protein